MRVGAIFRRRPASEELRFHHIVGHAANSLRAMMLLVLKGVVSRDGAERMLSDELRISHLTLDGSEVLLMLLYLSSCAHISSTA